ncbi:apolipoprotein N-acyltransferase [Leucobacter sp. W1478]|uniref:apolipoprotein N-acyltransferase n=1 Tax=Leucobacter sp. W1478 TaxID=3439065 RepID=UPI003F3475C2
MNTVRTLKWWIALPTAVLGGLALDAATPWLNWWPAGLLGATLVIASVWQQRSLAGLLLGAVAGAAFWGPHISWLTLYLGPIPWLALCFVMVSWFALFGLVAATATRSLSQLQMATAARVAVQAGTVAGLWVLREQLQSTLPYGGFAWGRLAHTQAEGPFAEVVSWVGFAGLSGILALMGALLVATTFAGGVRPRNPRGKRIWVGAAVSVLALAALTLLPAAPLEESGTLRVAAVQGNSKSGIFDDRESGDVLRDHLAATESLLDELEAEGETVDVIVWPENSAEFDLPGNPYGGYAVQRLASRAEAPIVVGTILRDPDGRYTNSTLVFDGAGDTGLRYDKRRPVPFAEYMPDREFYRSLVPDLIDLVQLDYAFGNRPTVLPIEGRTGEFDAGIAICFDIIFDDHASLMVGEGADVIFAQTNNADFGRTDESAQQLQIARLRAIETGRALVNISTVGTSAVVMPGGTDLARLDTFTADAMVTEVPLVQGETPALRFGALVAGAWMTIAVGGTLLGIFGGLLAGSGARHRKQDAETELASAP